PASSPASPRITSPVPAASPSASSKPPSAAVAASPSASPPAPVASIRACRAADLTAYAAPSATKSTIPDWPLANTYRLINRSRGACTLHGWATIALIGDYMTCLGPPYPSQCVGGHAGSRSTPRTGRVSRLNLGSIQTYTVQ